ncbi:MAG TPA: ABC transporter permease subunit [Kribbella sp.]|uniref:ABC transporter permease subunit n=1 Tax=Kribbella sp. TaxID=1871183 RepID=UPI002D787CEF|nr:ABC transporter permease subunit [Kribbella sp.]HET6297883.1 ABC transporter permease subunit [Kribbella sp.]
MIWLTWRQFRLQALVVLGVVAALAIILAITGPGLLDNYQSNKTDFLSRAAYDQINQILYLAGIALLYAAPPVIGAFWGAPLIARELEAGTHRLVWSQSISRSRWLAIKVGLTGLTAVAVTGLLSLAVTWWSDPIDDAVGSGEESGIFSMPRLLPTIFGGRGVVPIGYAAFAFALGVTIGLLVRRSVVAIAITLAAVVLVQILSPFFLRPHLITPAETTVIVTMENMRGLQMSGPEDDATVMRVEAKLPGSGFWKLSENTVNASGQVQSTLPGYLASCGSPPPGLPAAEAAKPRPSMDSCFKRLADEGYRQLITYHPASRFWGLQWREAGIFFALAFALTGFCFWRIRRDLS